MPRKEKRLAFINRGLCGNCGARPYDDGETLCWWCIYRHRLNSKRYYWRHAEEERIKGRKKTIKRKMNGQCILCAEKLHPEADVGCSTCITCREGMHK